MILKNIKEKCKEKGLSIFALEKKAGIGNGTIARWEKSSPTLDNLQAVAKVLECTVDNLLHDEDAAVEEKTA